MAERTAYGLMSLQVGNSPFILAHKMTEQGFMPFILTVDSSTVAPVEIMVQQPQLHDYAALRAEYGDLTPEEGDVLIDAADAIIEGLTP